MSSDTPFLDCALQYIGRGWPIFRVTGYKTPLKGSHGHLDATTDLETVTRWWTEKPRANIALATGALVALDLDGAEWSTSPRGKSLLALLQAHGGLPKTLASRTARGLHLIFKAPPGVEIRSSNEARAKNAPGVDIKGTGGWIVLPPSVNRKAGFRYHWAFELPPIEMPDWLVEWVQDLGAVPSSGKLANGLGEKPVFLQQNHSIVAARASEALKEKLNIEDWQRVIGALKCVSAESRDIWLQVGMGLHATGDGIAFKVWDRWSRTCPAKYNPYDLERTWESFGRTGREEVGLGTIFHIAKENGWQPPAPAAVEPPRKEVMPTDRNDRHATPSETKPQSDIFAPVGAQHVNGHASAATVLPKDEKTLIDLNAKYSVIGDVGGKCLVLGWVPSKVDESILVPSFQTHKTFSERYSNKYVEAWKVKNGQWVQEVQSMGAAWLKWPQRSNFEGIDLVPADEPVLPGNVLNLWKGFAVEPRRGRWDLMRRHIAKVLARGDLVSMEYIVKWAAWKVQHPGERAETALVFKGAKGSGKGTFANALRRMFGQHGLQIFNSKHLVGSFNGHLRNCLLLFADEAFWAGDKQGESVLKGMLTEPALMIEQKGVDATPWKNRLGVIMAANADWVVPASHDERRYAVFDVSSERVKDKKYFEALHAELSIGGLQAMLYDLQHVELGSFHPRQLPQTEALQQQKLRSLAPLFEWYEALLSDGVLSGCARDTTMVPAALLLGQAREAVPRLRDVTATALGRMLSEMGAEKVHTEKGSAWKFGELAKCRAAWVERFGAWKWSNPAPTWTVR